MSHQTGAIGMTRKDVIVSGTTEMTETGAETGKDMTAGVDLDMTNMITGEDMIVLNQRYVKHYFCH